MHCGCIESAAGFLAGVAISALAWHVLSPVSWSEGLSIAAIFTMALTVGAKMLGQRRARTSTL